MSITWLPDVHLLHFETSPIALKITEEDDSCWIFGWGLEAFSTKLFFRVRCHVQICKWSVTQTSERLTGFFCGCCGGRHILYYFAIEAWFNVCRQQARLRWMLHVYIYVYQQLTQELSAPKDRVIWRNYFEMCFRRDWISIYNDDLFLESSIHQSIEHDWRWCYRSIEVVWDTGSAPIFIEVIIKGR